MDRVIHFIISGEEPCEYTGVIKSQVLTIKEGAPTEDDLKLKLLVVTGDSTSLVEMFDGIKPPMTLVNKKLIQMKGSVIDSMSFSRLWDIQKKY